ncbi:MAG: DUF922 domain-containing protein [Flavobacteriaceae bacterium]
MGTVRIFILAILLGQAGAFAQKEEVIPWHRDYKLTWENFKDTPLRTEWAAATTASGISYAFNAKEVNGRMVVKMDINAFFYPQKSWYRPELCDAMVLAHEQLHFDISELFARKMRQKVAGAQFTDNVKAEVKAIYKETLREMNEFQNQYDHQTDFSRNKEQQYAWNEKVAQALRSHEQYSGN